MAPLHKTCYQQDSGVFCLRDVIDFQITILNTFHEVRMINHVVRACQQRMRSCGRSTEDMFLV